MSMLRRILTTISYVCVGGSPLLAATGVGAPVAVVLGAAGLAAGAWLHFLDSPKTPADVLAVAKDTVALAKAVQAAKTAP